MALGKKLPGILLREVINMVTPVFVKIASPPDTLNSFFVGDVSRPELDLI